MKLYNKSKTGKIIEWSIEIEGSKFRAITGQVDGKLITGAWTTCEGKNIGRSNETSPEKQAIKEVEAKIIKKKEEGYRETVEELADLDGSVQEIVMLADKWKDCEVNIPNDEILATQPKLDGIRCKAQKELVSRKNKVFVGCPHILEEVKKLNLNFALDGEMYNHDYKADFNAIVSIVKKSKPTTEDLQLSEKLMQYHIYDCMAPGDFLDRYKLLVDLFLHNEFKYLKLVPVHLMTKSSIDVMHDMYVDQGYEGIIIRRNTPYEYFRSKNLLKLKHWIDEEFEIMDVEEGVGNRAGMMGHIILKINGKLFHANAKGTFAYYKDLWENKQNYIGKFATLKYQNLTPDGIPRFGTVIAIRDYE